MLKYIGNHLADIDGIALYPMISFMIFFAFFTGLIIYVMTTKKSKINEISNYPLND